MTSAEAGVGTHIGYSSRLTVPPSDSLTSAVYLHIHRSGRRSVSVYAVTSWTAPAVSPGAYARTYARTATRGRGRRERSEAPLPVSKVACSPCDRQDGGGRVPYGEAAILGHPAGQQAACQPH